MNAFSGTKIAVFCFCVVVPPVGLVVGLVVVPVGLVVENLADIFMKHIAIHSLYSLWRIAAGLLLAVAVGLPLGVLMGYFPKCDRFLSPLVYLTYPVPKIAIGGSITETTHAIVVYTPSISAPVR